MNTEGLTATEAECAAGRTAPRVSLADIEANVTASTYRTGIELFSAAAEMTTDIRRSLGTLTICILVLQNGFTVIGKSAPASPDNFDPVLGQKLAYEDAVRQVWPLMGYELRERLSCQPVSAAACARGGNPSVDHELAYRRVRALELASGPGKSGDDVIADAEKLLTFMQPA